MPTHSFANVRGCMQVLHVARHLVWYTLVRPARHGDWAGLFISAINVVYPGTMLLVAVSSRSGPVWAWWRRWVRKPSYDVALLLGTSHCSLPLLWVNVPGLLLLLLCLLEHCQHATSRQGQAVPAATL